MPTYEYHCKNCGAIVELNSTMSESSDTPMCTGCHGGMTRSYNVAGVQFKGSGWGGQ